MHRHKKIGWIILLIFLVGFASFYDKNVSKIKNNAQEETIIHAD